LKTLNKMATLYNTGTLHNSDFVNKMQPTKLIVFIINVFNLGFWLCMWFMY
jgi:hypothetical protein